MLAIAIEPDLRFEWDFCMGEEEEKAFVALREGIGPGAWLT